MGASSFLERRVADVSESSRSRIKTAVIQERVRGPHLNPPPATGGGGKKVNAAPRALTFLPRSPGEDRGGGVSLRENTSLAFLNLQSRIKTAVIQERARGPHLNPPPGTGGGRKRAKACDQCASARRLLSYAEYLLNDTSRQRSLRAPTSRQKSVMVSFSTSAVAGKSFLPLNSKSAAAVRYFYVS